MSKKLIAVASAAALALTALVGVAPATASSTAVLGAGFVASSGVNDGTTAEKAATVNVPAANILTTGASTAGTLDIGAAAGAAIEITTTGPVKVIRSLTGLTSASANWNVANLGKASLSYAAVAGSADDSYVYNTSTTTGSVTVKVTTTTTTLTNTFYVKGVAGNGYNLKVTGPDTLAKGKVGVISATVTDIFGNAVENAAAATYAAGKISITVSRFPQAAATPPASGLVWNATAKAYQGEVTSLSNGAFTLEVKMQNDSGSAFADIAEVAGIADGDFGSVIVNVNSAGVSAQVAALTAQIATLTATVAKRVSKKKYNTLARKWNAAFPSQKVALKK